MKEPLKILFISQEIKPYLPENELSIICREFPQFAQENGCEIRTFMPCFGHINERRNQLHEVQRLSGMNLILDDTDHPLIIKVASIQSARMQVYFIDNEDYFSRKGVGESTTGELFEDNDERAIFYVRGVLETIKKLRWTPDVICCSGWITSVAPIYIKKVYNSDPFFENSKVVYCIYGDKFQGNLKPDLDKKIMLDGIEPSDLKTVENTVVDCNVFNKLAIDFSDAVVAGNVAINEDVLRYVEEKKIPLLSYAAENADYKMKCLEFIRNLFS